MNTNKLIKDKLKEVDDFFYSGFKFDPNDVTLKEQITLGKDWDNPKKLSMAMDQHSARYIQWAFLMKQLKVQKEKLELKYKVWESKKKEFIRQSIIDKRVKKELTEKQAMQNITQAMVDGKFNIRYNYKNEIFVKYKKPVDDIDLKLEQVSLVVEAFKQRKDLLVVLGYVVKSMIENNLLVVYNKKDKK